MASTVMYCLFSVLLLGSQLCGTEAKMPGNSKIIARELSATKDPRQVHIVYLGGVSDTSTTNHPSHHASMLQQAMGSEDDASQHILYSYTNSFNGFAAYCTPSQAENLKGIDGVISVFKSEHKQTQTTNSWEFLGLTPSEGLWPQSNFGSAAIVGVIDTGIWPESKSFSDEGFGPVPSRWKGGCVAGENFTASLCNKKLIGAKYYFKGFEATNGAIQPPEIKSARDQQGHGTHTASTAAGRQVANASFLGVGTGTVKGGAPSARVAMYKACWFGSCTDADLLAAFDDAITDGVDLLSISLAGAPSDYLADAFAIGSFHAVAKGIVVTCSAGNAGPSQGTVTNIAPWIFTVGASTIDRVYKANVKIGKKLALPGIAINTFKMNSTFPVAYAGDILAANQSAPDCLSSFNSTLAAGKIILCQGSTSSLIDQNVQLSGGVGYIAVSDVDQAVQFDTTMPSTNVNTTTGASLLNYARHAKNPLAKILPSVAVFNTTKAPVAMAYFSSVGPNTITPGINKPDITAPGVDILAAWSPIANPSEHPGDTRSTDFNTISGTSMSCPHVSGLVALVKSVHLDWSPAAIKSAIMTTATPLDASISLNSGFSTGSGQINPTKAADPGLVFNLTTTDYSDFLCSLGYNNSQISIISGVNQTCPRNPPSVQDLNYPSISVASNLTVGSVYNITRTVTNVGPASSTYSVSVAAPSGLNVAVEPSTLSFSKINEEQKFHVLVTVTDSQRLNLTSTPSFGSLTWTDSPNTHSVRVVLAFFGL